MNAPEPVTITLPAARQAIYWETQGIEGGDCGMSPAEECASCDGPFEDGDPVRQIGTEWLHELCAVAAITGTTPDLAWLILADQVCARPSAFRASDASVVRTSVPIGSSTWDGCSAC